jgi:deoxyribodipyrimidine photolyase-related protein
MKYQNIEFLLDLDEHIIDVDYFLILPTQLYELKYLPDYLLNKKAQKKSLTVILWECPCYFNNKKYKFNQKKLMLHKASMEYYYKYLQSAKIKVKFIKYDEDIKKVLINSKHTYNMFDPIDDIELLDLPFLPTTIEESPNFLLKSNDYEKYHTKSSGKFFFNSFYTYGKKIVDVIPDIKSTDKENRKTLTKKELDKMKIPPPPILGLEDEKYIDIAIKYVDKNFSKNYGDTDAFMFPVTHSTAKKWLNYFIKKKFDQFGDYQDFVNKDNSFMFHSLLSTSINIGLLTPLDIISVIEKYKKSIPINSYEGYVRQLFWREYQRYTYIYFYSDPKNAKLNYFGNKKKLTSKWYTGDLGSPPLDHAIKTGFKNGYLHHIDRLMIVGNYMNLSGINPQEALKWFMEFPCDSYIWVMGCNVYGMALFSDGGKTMRRPYISGSNYVLKMSNFPKGDWVEKLDKMYHSFVSKNKSKLLKYRYYIKIK